MRLFGKKETDLPYTSKWQPEDESKEITYEVELSYHSGETATINGVSKSVADEIKQWIKDDSIKSPFEVYDKEYDGTTIIYKQGCYKVLMSAE